MPRDFAGARWWKFDFHTHTPASEDYGKGPNQKELCKITPQKWLLGFMRAEIDCVAVTDHNSGAWVGKLQDAYKKLEKERPEGFRPLHLFPGVEITVSGGIHLLAIFDLDYKEAQINSFLGAAGINNRDLGKINAVTDKSFIEVVQAVHRSGGLAIPAHADSNRGVFKVRNGDTLRQILRSEHIIAAEVLDKDQVNIGAIGEHWNEWSCVLGSDSHHPSGAPGQNFPGSRFTWIKMGAPCIEGVKLALIDGEPFSVRRSDETDYNPNKQAPYVIESINVCNARLMGRPNQLEARFSPWMSALIGGRGTGKSTIVEMLRLVLRRDKELPDGLADNFKQFKAVPKSRDHQGALTENTEVAADIVKDGKRFRVRWREDGTETAIEQQSMEGSWTKADGVIEQRFPVRIFSQKQVLSLAQDPNALLRLINDDPAVDWYAWHSGHRQLEAQYLSLCSQIREIDSRVTQRDRLKGELADVRGKIKIFESAGHRDLLTLYQRMQEQWRAVEDRSSELKESAKALQECAAEIEPTNLPEGEVDLRPPDVEAHQLLLEAHSKQQECADQIAALATDISNFQKDWEQRAKSSAWAQAVQKVVNDVKELRRKLEEQGTGGSMSFGGLVQRRQTLEAELEKLEATARRKNQLEREASAVLDKVEASRLDLTRKRIEFLAQVTQNDRFIRVSLVSAGDGPKLAEKNFRKILKKPDKRFEDDILSVDETKGVLVDLYRKLPDDADSRSKKLAERVRNLKRELDRIHQGEALESRSKWFHNHIQDLTDEELDRLRLWWPEDSLKVEYIRDGHGFVPIEQGSPGQKSAAILAFLLSYGDEPLVLDQPEDDLDNYLIYDLIVQQIRENKQRRQVIVATHNPNIVVNGDAEQVIEMDYVKGQCVVGSGTGCLQESGVREAICSVMEGGEKAFQSRYRRLVN